MLRVGPAARKANPGLAGDHDTAIESMKKLPWTALTDLKGDPEILKKIEDAETLLKNLRKSLSS
jgi:ParB family chromosome partitioning protein